MSVPRLPRPVLRLILCLPLVAGLAGCSVNGRTGLGSSLFLCDAGNFACIRCFENVNATAAFCGAADPAAYCAVPPGRGTRDCLFMDRCQCDRNRTECVRGAGVVQLMCAWCDDGYFCGLAKVEAPAGATGELPRAADADSRQFRAVDLASGDVYAATGQGDDPRPPGAPRISWDGVPTALVEGDPGPPWELVARFRPELLQRRLLAPSSLRQQAGEPDVAPVIAPAKRGVTEFPAPGYQAFPAGIAAGPDGNLWITVPTQDKVIKLTPIGQATTFALSVDSVPFGIVAGPDGAIWHTLAGDAAIARIDPVSGARRSFTIRDTSTPWPAAITVGPDGNLWFTEAHGNKIGRLTPAGTMTQFDVLTADANPMGIVAGPDGNLWFTEMAAGKIGRITPTGTVTEFGLATATTQPTFIAAGPDGNLWFTEQAGSAIGRITPAGAIDRFPLPDAGTSPFGIAAGPDGKLWFTELDGHRVGSITTAGVIEYHTPPTAESAPAIIAPGPGSALWFTEMTAGKVGKVTTAGAFTELPLPLATAGPLDIVAAPDENLWFLETTKSRLVRMATNGTLTEFPIIGPKRGVQTAPTALTVGPDFNIWFTDSGLRMIGRATPAGAITLFPVPNPGTGLAPSPTAIVTGPDHALWFTDYWGARIGRMTLAGEVTLFPIPKPGEYSASPLGIAAGPDGNLWFTDDDNAVVSKITTAGEVTHYAMPSGASADPTAITLGPDGNLWFTERTANKIGRITTAGAVTEFAVPTSSADLGGITTGPDGNLWFTERYGNGAAKLGRITPAGVVTEVVLPDGKSDPFAITTGPDEALWFTERAASRIGRLDPNQLEPPTPPPGDWLTSSGLPGFQAKVQITAGSTVTAGKMEEDCIADTLCVSGALAGRPEVFVRVVGPKPNGYLWPTLVKFSTSQIEIWVQQINGGELRYYLLPAVDPGADLLDLAGLADKVGFQPKPDTSWVEGVAAADGLVSSAERRGAEAPTESVSRPALFPAPPPGDWLTSSGLPGFAAKVRVTAGPTVLDGVAEEDCIADTLCVSGALPGRPEVFVRVVGPKPNGYLWPTLVKFSTSQIEIWVQKQANGDTRYYLLPAVDPGADLLDLAGLADKLGFTP